MAEAEQRTVVVTGGAQGIGEKIATTFAADGCATVVLDLKAPEQPAAGIRYVEADISDPQSVATAFADLERVDVLVNNAGIARSGLVGRQPVEDFVSVIQTNLIGAFLCASQAVPKMPEGGSVISIASTAALLGLPGRGAYSAAKAGLLGLTRVWGVELAPRGIRANAVCPGWIRTPLAEQALADGSLQLDWMMRRVPAKRLAETEEIANVVRFLAGEEASFITGQAIVADGGWTVQGIDESPDWLS
jgi:NAD(P)-dependent dehydrogenase (short-subunit alcohol dehydrogenase family)